MNLKRREFCAWSMALGVTGSEAMAQSQSANIHPVWLGFGLNIGANAAAQRFPLSNALLPIQRPGRKTTFQLEVNEAISQQLRALGDTVTFQNATDIGGDTLLGAVLDYENVLEARLGDANFIVMHMVGHGVLLDFDRTRGWSMRASYPFPVTLLRESKGSTESTAKQYLADAYLDPQNSFATSFAKATKRLSPRWKQNGGASGFNIRVTSCTIHPDVAVKLKTWGIEKNISPTWLGHLASAAICEGLDVPVVPFAETQSLGNYTYKFSDRLTAQNVRMPSDDDIDLRIHVSLRNMAREIKYRNQFERWEAARMIVLDIKVKDESNQDILAIRMGYQDEQPDALAREEDNSPARDAHFFDMAIYRGLNLFFSGVEKGDLNLLAKVMVKPDPQQSQAINEFKRRYRNGFAKGV